MTATVLTPSDVAQKLDALVQLVRDAERLAKELDGARLSGWFGREDLTWRGVAKMVSNAQDVSLAAHDVGRRMDLVAHLLRAVAPPVPQDASQ
jgi:hypothetical protein